MTLRHWLVALGAAFLLGWAGCWIFSRRGADAKLEANTGKIRVADTVLVIQRAKTDTVSATVTRFVERWRTDTAYRKDTITLRDTLRILVPKTVFDSTISACGELVMSCQRERIASQAAIRARDERIKILGHKPWHSRLGCAGGYGAVLSGGLVQHGAGVTCGLQFP